MDGNEELSRRMADKVDFRGAYGLANSLLAALPVREYITTNVDAMLERASQVCLCALCVLCVCEYLC